MRFKDFWSLCGLLAITATGCSVNYSTCDSGCGCGSGQLFGSRAIGCDGSVDCADRQGLPRPALLSRLRGAANCGCGSSQCTTGCDSGACDSGCGCSSSSGIGNRGFLGNGAVRGGLFGGGLVGGGGAACNDCGTSGGTMGPGLALPALGGGMFAQSYESSASCATGDCGGMAGGYADGSVMPVGGLLGQGGMVGGGGHIGCGHFGCGTNGRLCLGCRLKGAMGLRGRRAAQHPYGGQIPHTDPNAYADQGAMGGQPVPAYAYPYYTTRGPRDFLQDKPASIGW